MRVYAANLLKRGMLLLLTKFSFLYFQPSVKIRRKVGKILAAIDLTELVFGWGFAPYSAGEVTVLSG